MDDEAIQRRRELMRQRAKAKAEIGIGQEEIMVRLKGICDVTIFTVKIVSRSKKKKSPALMKTRKRPRRRPQTRRRKRIRGSSPYSSGKR